MNIILAGRGKMATEMERTCVAHGITVTYPERGFKLDSNQTVAVHFGSGTQLVPLIDLCEEVRVPIIQGSTGFEVPRGREVIIVNAPNLSIPMIRFILAFPSFARQIMPGMRVGIVESHQRKKTDTSGTARAIAKSFNLPGLTIKSVRDEDTQLALGVPREHMGGHAYHYFTFTGQGVEIMVSTRIRGRATYAEGALLLAQALCALPEPLAYGVYELENILDLLPKD